MKKFNVGDQVSAIFTQNLPTKEVAPKLKQGEKYIVKQIFTDNGGFDHIDVGLDNDVEFIKSFHTGEMLPSGVRWCHPNRFVLA